MKRITFVLLTYVAVVLIAGAPQMYSKYKSDDRLKRTGSRMCYADGSELDLTSERSNHLEPMATIYCK